MQSTAMELKVFNAHSGKVLTTNPYIFHSFAEFKEWTSEQFDIPLGSLLLLTAHGQRVKEPAFHNLNEIFAFDKPSKDTLRKSHTNEGDAQMPKKSPYDFIDNIPREAHGVLNEEDVFYENNDVIKPIQSPLVDFDLEENRNNYRTLISVITTNSSWSTAVLSDAIFLEKNIHEKITEISNIFRGLNITGKYLDHSFNETNNKFGLSNDIITNLRINSLNDAWENYYDNLRNINLFNDNKANLTSLLPYEELQQSAKESWGLHQDLAQRTDKLEKELVSVKSKKIAMEKKIEIFKQNSIIKNFNNLNLNDILKQIKTLTKTVQTETKNIMELVPDYQHLRADTILSKKQLDTLINTISNHQKVYVPELLQLANDLYYLQLNLIALFKKLKATFSEVMEKTAMIQGDLLKVRGDLKTVVKEIDNLQVIESSICTVIDVPLLYGIFLLENMRRIEWEAELKEIVEKTVENFALINDKEIKLRSKWEKNYGLILRLLKLEDVFTMHNLLNVDLTTNKDNSIKELTLNVRRSDVAEYISTLKRNGVSQDAVNVLQNGLEDLDNQKVSLYSKFDGYLNLNITKDANSTDNELIKSYQIRIKKLESILHQHKYKNLNQWPLMFPQIGGRDNSSRSKSPPIQNGARTANIQDVVANKLNLASPRSLSTTSLNKVSTVTTVEKVKASPKPETRKNSFSRMFGMKPKKESILLGNGGNIELTNSMILLTEAENKNKVLFNPKTSKDLLNALDEAQLNTEIVRIPNVEWSKIKNKNNELFLQNTDMSSQNKKLKETVCNLTAELDQSKSKLQQYGAQEELIARLNNENAELNQELENVAIELKGTQSELSSKYHEISAKNREIENQNKRLEGISVDVLKYKSEKEEAQKELLENQKELGEVYRKFGKSETRLKKLLKEYEKSQEQNKDLQITIDGHQQTINRLKEDFENHKKQSEEQNSAEFQNQIDSLNGEVKFKVEEIEKLKSDLAKLEESYKDISTMKNDLLANMQSKEADFAKERNTSIEEINKLKAKVEELEDNEEALETINKELAGKNSTLINLIILLLDTNTNFKNKLRELTSFMLSNFKLICSCFEAVGLLITKNDIIPESILQNNDITKLGEPFINHVNSGDEKGIKIIRVKGLRNKNKYKEEPSFDKPLSPLVADVEGSVNWIGGNADTKLLIEDAVSPSHHEAEKSLDGSQVGSSLVDIEKIEHEAQEVIDTYNHNASFEKQYFNFISSVIIDYELIHTSISKRFGDIEHLAKKLQKENKAHKEEIVKLLSEARYKIAVNNFKLGDLVLFLPTRDGNAAASVNGDLVNQPWAAFNIGSPHYFLKENNGTGVTNKDWMVSRILSITEHKITSKNYSIREENPFALSQGVTWYLVEAKEESLENSALY